MDATTEVTTVERELSIAASPETVWEFLVDPEKAVRWMGTTRRLRATPGRALLPRGDPRATSPRASSPRSTARTGSSTRGWEQSTQEGAIAPGSTRIEIGSRPRAKAPRSGFRHDLPTATAAESHARGWDHYLGAVRDRGARSGPGRRPVAQRRDEARGLPSSPLTPHVSGR